MKTKLIILTILVLIAAITIAVVIKKKKDQSLDNAQERNTGAENKPTPTTKKVPSKIVDQVEKIVQVKPVEKEKARPLPTTENEDQENETTLIIREVEKLQKLGTINSNLSLS